MTYHTIQLIENSRDVPIPKFEPIPVPIPILNFKAKPILNRYRYLDFSVLKLFTYTAFYSKGDTSQSYEQATPKQLIPNLTN